MPIRVKSSGFAPPQQRQTPAQALAGFPAPPPGYVQRSAGLSLCMIVKNEERFLEQCLRSAVDVVDEICIVDTGSTDGTLAIAQRFGARIEQREWRNDFAWARNQALEMATKRWILVLDADEELLPQSYPTLRALKSTPAYRHGVWMRVLNKASDFVGSGEMTHALIRIFPAAPEIRYKGAIHEFATVNDDPNGLQACLSEVTIRHYGYVNEVVQSKDKGQRNLAIVQSAVERDPADPFNWFNLGSTLFLVGRMQEAADALEHAVEVNAGKPRGFMPNCLSVLAQIYTDHLGDPQRAIELLELCLTYSPSYANAHFGLGKAYLSMKNYEAARKNFECAIADAPHNRVQFIVDDEVSVWKAHSEIGSTYVAQGDDERALEWFEKGIVNRPTAQAIRMNRARCLERLGRHEAASEAYRGLYEEFGDEFSALNYINYLMRTQQDAQALHVIETALPMVAPRSAAALLVGAFAVARRNGWLGDVAYLERAVELMPGCAEALGPLEAIYRQRGDDVALARLLEAEAASEPQDALDFLRRSHQSLERREYADALRWASSGLERFPDDGKLRYNVALALVNLERVDEALDHLAAVPASDDEAWLGAGYLQAVLLRKQGALQDALAALDRLLNHAPGHVDGLLLRAAVLEESDRFDEAEVALLAIPRREDRRVSMELATFYLRRGRMVDAQRIAEEALAT
ncbi:MAG: tetratricopeptide repeat-containing glycosyltransferase family 2 protein [Vulcanimicrobiaceae bacterium]